MILTKQASFDEKSFSFSQWTFDDAKITTGHENVEQNEQTLFNNDAQNPNVEPSTNGCIGLGDEKKLTRGGDKVESREQEQALSIQKIPKRNPPRSCRPPELFV